MIARRLPLGVDIGSSRVRVVALARNGKGGLRLLGASAAEIDADGDAGAALASAVENLGIRERRCAMTVRACDASLRVVAFPSMSRRELRRAALFEGMAMFGGEPGPIAVRCIPLDGGRGLVVATRHETVRNLLSLAARIGLRAMVLDHEALALARAGRLPLLDVGARRSTLVFELDGVPMARTLPVGGETFSAALAHEYGTSRAVAENRKRTIGLAGACAEALRSFCQALDRELRELRAEGLTIRSLHLCGNGVRLVALREALERSLGLTTAFVEIDRTLETELPASVTRAGVVDWYGAFAAALPCSQRYAA